MPHYTLKHKLIAIMLAWALLAGEGLCFAAELHHTTLRKQLDFSKDERIASNVRIRDVLRHLYEQKRSLAQLRAIKWRVENMFKNIEQQKDLNDVHSKALAILQQKFKENHKAIKNAVKTGKIVLFDHARCAETDRKIPKKAFPEELIIVAANGTFDPIHLSHVALLSDGIAYTVSSLEKDPGHTPALISYILPNGDAMKAPANEAKRWKADKKSAKIRCDIAALLLEIFTPLMHVSRLCETYPEYNEIDRYYKLIDLHLNEKQTNKITLHIVIGSSVFVPHYANFAKILDDYNNRFNNNVTISIIVRENPDFPIPQEMERKEGVIILRKKELAHIRSTKIRQGDYVLYPANVQKVIRKTYSQSASIASNQKVIATEDTQHTNASAAQLKERLMREISELRGSYITETQFLEIIASTINTHTPDDEPGLHGKWQRHKKAEEILGVLAKMPEVEQKPVIDEIIKNYDRVTWSATGAHRYTAVALAIYNLLQGRDIFDQKAIPELIARDARFRYLSDKNLLYANPYKVDAALISSIIPKLDSLRLPQSDEYVIVDIGTAPLNNDSEVFDLLGKGLSGLPQQFHFIGTDTFFPPYVYNNGKINPAHLYAQLQENHGVAHGTYATYYDGSIDRYNITSDQFDLGNIDILIMIQMLHHLALPGETPERLSLIGDDTLIKLVDNNGTVLDPKDVSYDLTRNQRNAVRRLLYSLNPNGGIAFLHIKEGAFLKGSVAVSNKRNDEQLIIVQRSGEHIFQFSDEVIPFRGNPSTYSSHEFLMTEHRSPTLKCRGIRRVYPDLDEGVYQKIENVLNAADKLVSQNGKRNHAPFGYIQKAVEQFRALENKGLPVDEFLIDILKVYMSGVRRQDSAIKERIITRAREALASGAKVMGSEGESTLPVKEQKTVQLIGGMRPSTIIGMFTSLVKRIPGIMIKTAPRPLFQKAHKAQALKILSRSGFPAVRPDQPEVIRAINHAVAAYEFDPISSLMVSPRTAQLIPLRLQHSPHHGSHTIEACKIVTATIYERIDAVGSRNLFWDERYVPIISDEGIYDAQGHPYTDEMYAQCGYRKLIEADGQPVTLRVLTLGGRVVGVLSPDEAGWVAGYVAEDHGRRYLRTLDDVIDICRKNDISVDTDITRDNVATIITDLAERGIIHLEVKAVLEIKGAGTPDFQPDNRADIPETLKALRGKSVMVPNIWSSPIFNDKFINGGIGVLTPLQAAAYEVDPLLAAAGIPLLGITVHTHELLSAEQLKMIEGKSLAAAWMNFRLVDDTARLEQIVYTDGDNNDIVSPKVAIHYYRQRYHLKDTQNPLPYAAGDIMRHIASSLRGMIELGVYRTSTSNSMHNYSMTAKMIDTGKDNLIFCDPLFLQDYERGNMVAAMTSLIALEDFIAEYYDQELISWILEQQSDDPEQFDFSRDFLDLLNIDPKHYEALRKECTEYTTLTGFIAVIKKYLFCNRLLLKRVFTDDTATFFFNNESVDKDFAALLYDAGWTQPQAPYARKVNGKTLYLFSLCPPEKRPVNISAFDGNYVETSMKGDQNVLWQLDRDKNDTAQNTVILAADRRQQERLELIPEIKARCEAHKIKVIVLSTEALRQWTVLFAEQGLVGSYDFNQMAAIDDILTYQALLETLL